MFKLTAVCVNASKQSFSPLLYGFDDDGVIEFVPFFNNSVLQMFQIGNSITIDAFLQYAPNPIIDRIEVG